MKVFFHDWLASPSSHPGGRHVSNKAAVSILRPLAANTNRPFAGGSRVARPPRRQLGRRPLSHRVYSAGGKRILDTTLVLITLPISFLVIFISSLALLIEGGSPFYRQDRLGKDGRVFSIWKLRTMVRDADVRLAEYLEKDAAMRDEWETTQKLKNDPRITPVGAFLRATSIDEMPQFFNVLLGDMSLVGPRPMMPEQLEIYGNPHSYFALKPGITGNWQVSARNAHSFSSRARFDAAYFRTVSLASDMILLFKTVRVVLRRTGY